jgi:ribosome biogenesis GTPase
MARRKLTKQQKLRIRARQQSHTEQPADHHEFRHGRVLQHHGKQAWVEDEHQSLIECTIRQNLGYIVCGDYVVWQAAENGEQGVITAIQPRSSVLARPDFRRQPKPFAANIDQILIITAIEPEINLHLLDRYLVVIEKLGIDCVIVANKIDILDDKQYQELKIMLQVYAELGYSVLYTSARNDEGIQALQQQLQDKSSILVGQSGVGKSSLINQLIPDRELRTGALSQASHGKHTTSASTLYHLPFGGDIIDSPGIRNFGVWHITADDVHNGFREIHQLQGQCRFHNCRHVNEPDCAVIDAVKQGKIAATRHQSYLAMLAEAEQSDNH